MWVKLKVKVNAKSEIYYLNKISYIVFSIYITIHLQLIKVLFPHNFLDICIAMPPRLWIFPAEKMSEGVRERDEEGREERKNTKRNGIVRSKSHEIENFHFSKIASNLE